MTEMQKCPYCAEWVPLNAERCPNCEQQLAAPPPLEKTAPFVEVGVTDLINDFRKQVDGEDPEEQFPSIDFYSESDDALPDDSEELSFLQDDLTSGGLSVFKNRDVTDFSSTQSDVGFVPSRYEEPDERELQRQLSPALVRRALMVAGSLVGLLACISIVVILGRPLIGSIFAAAPEATETITPTATPTKRSIPGTSVSTLTKATDTPPPVSESGADCVSWDSVGADNVGEKLCVYGVVRRWFASGDIPFVAIFSEDLGTFAFIDRTTTYSRVRPGTCVTATGTVKLMRSVRPHIEVQGDLEICN